MMNLLQNAPFLKNATFLKSATLIIVLVLNACGGNPRLDYSLTTDFSKLKTYHLDLAGIEPIYRFFDSGQILDKQLSQSGFVPAADKDDADFTVRVSIAYAGEKSLVNLGLGVGQSASSGNGLFGIGVSSGIPLGVKSLALVNIDIADGKTGTLLWRNNRDASYGDEEEKQTSIAEALVLLLSDFPPKKKEQ